MKIIGLTGGIGTGKSTVSNYLAQKGYNIIDADKIAREIVEPGSPALDEIKAAFGDDMILPDGTLNRKGLAAIVFNDPVKRSRLEKITMGKICDIIEECVAAARTRNIKRTEYEEIEDLSQGAHQNGSSGVFGGSLTFIDAPLLFDAGLEKLTDTVWVVTADTEVRLRRAALRDGSSREEILARINNQMSREEYEEKADEIIDNSGTLQELHDRIDALLKKYADNGN